LFDQPDYSRRMVYWLPWLFGYNTYNRLPVGVMVYSGMVPGYDYGISLVPLYDYVHQTMAGFGTVKKTWYRRWGFKKAETALSGDRYFGHSGLHLGFTGTRRPTLHASPSFDVKADYFYHDLYDQAAFNPDLYSTGTLSTLRFQGTWRRVYNPLFHLSATAGIEGALAGGDFWKGELSFQGSYRWTRAITSTWRAWVGSFFVDSDVPQQYETFMGGGVDPDFEQRYVLDRMNGFTGGKYNLYDEQYLAAGPGLRGRTLLEESTSTNVFSTRQPAFGINLDQSLPKLPLKLFLDLGGNRDVSLMTDAGLILDLSGLQLIIPLYQSWDGDQTPTDLKWIRDRLRFTMSVPGIRFGR
ncbi:MAG: hypothetical protein D6762_02595, partial [Candidatus Neomarinimicrobiota bacterium]